MSKASDALQKGADYFKKRLAEQELTPIKVPAWDVTIYRPSKLTLRRLDRVKRAMSSGGLDHLADIIVEVARDEDGNPFFAGQSRDLWKRQLCEEQDPDLLIWLAGELSDALIPEPIEDIEGNSNATTSSSPGSPSQKGSE